MRALASSSLPLSPPSPPPPLRAPPRLAPEVTPATTFWMGEAYHQEYFARNPAQPYCMWVVAEKVAKFRKHFLGKLKRK